MSPSPERSDRRDSTNEPSIDPFGLVIFTHCTKQLSQLIVGTGVIRGKADHLVQCGDCLMFVIVPKRDVHNGALVFGGFSQSTHLQKIIDERTSIADIVRSHRNDADVEGKGLLGQSDRPTELCRLLKTRDGIFDQAGSFFEVGCVESIRLGPLPQSHAVGTRRSAATSPLMLFGAS